MKEKYKGIGGVILIFFMIIAMAWMKAVTETRKRYPKISKSRSESCHKFNNTECKKIARTYPSFDYIKCDDKFYECVPNFCYSDEDKDIRKGTKYVEGTKMVNCHEIEDIDSVLSSYETRTVPKENYTSKVYLGAEYLNVPVIYEVYNNPHN